MSGKNIFYGEGQARIHHVVAYYCPNVEKKLHQVPSEEVKKGEKFE